ncbi:MAG: 3-dehydroquinate synthase [candidate division WOR-3 bacterium]|nr:3-dehydroquinate synthase [candidate division WOR-3 bacterium]
MPDNIVLIGFMGTGKDTVGRILARRLNMGFLSTDRMIELSEEMPVKEIFTKKGEDCFRKQERNVIHQIKDLKNLVVATGGGIVLNPDNRHILKRMGMVIQLSASPEILKKRIGIREDRPLIKKLSDIERLYRQRIGMYDFADFRLDTDDKEPAILALEIIDRLKLKRLDDYAKCETIRVTTRTKEYPVIIGFDIIDRLPLVEKRVLIITNPLVGALYLDGISEHLKKNLNRVEYIIIPDGERYKNFKTVWKIYDYLFRTDFQRRDFIISLGGGVINDIAGFVASTFKRGCGLIHIPTTLLAQIDAAIGGKTGIDTVYGKNMLGTFYQPEMVLCDLKRLTTLSEREFLNGIAEAIKYGVINSRKLFEILQNKRQALLNREIKILFEIVRRCVAIKCSIIKRDETEEKGIREVLNFGHTIGHTIETITGYKKFSHGEAVAMGMVEEINLLSRNKKDLQIIIDLLKKYNLPCDIPEEIKRSIKELIHRDKKASGKFIRMPVFEKIGRVRVKEVSCRKFY